LIAGLGDSEPLIVSEIC
jgi:hypothetical protein